MNVAKYDFNRRWSDRFLPEVKRIIGSYPLSEASDEFDMRHATDLMMLDARDLRIAVRVRRPGYAQRYPNKFTLRAELPSGTKTELAKIVDGRGDWLFYGHSAACEKLLAS